MIKEFTYRIPYFLWYLIKLPFIELMESLHSINSDKMNITKPKNVFRLLFYITILYTLIVGNLVVSKFLFIMTFISFVWKVWMSGDDIRDRKEKMMKKLLKKPKTLNTS